ncbi:DUF3822 family protein [Sphingobacterium bovistauri]|uniref:DUF3822 family protein n=1 Tax=Sphingobacterium bovistauri TaxID=2781959 RepID=A0ABS7Z0R4_9SPHI|nr:DUF3822 family protein [Sphingobacterium bovistauri]MCA5003755.1 DUF3822 family protein [Sphingobacterium bovistauri]
MNYISADFHLHYIPSYTLYIQSDLYRDHLIVVGLDNDVLVYIAYDNEKPSLEATKILSFPFENVYISLPHQSLVWVPSEVFDPTDLALYKDYFVETKIDKIQYKQIESQGVTALYQIDSTLQSRWKNAFPQATILPSFSALLSQAFNNINCDLELLCVHIYGTQADLFLFVNGEIRLFNTYEIHNPDDLAFYVLSIMKNFSISGKIQKVLLSGASIDSEWGKRIDIYTKQLVEMKSTFDWIVKNKDVSLSIKSLNTLADLSICE